MNEGVDAILEMTSLAVSPVVNSARVDDPRCCEPGESSEDPEKLKITRREPETDQQTWGCDGSPDQEAHGLRA